MNIAARRWIVTLRRLSPVRLLLLGYLSYSALGWLVLALPIVQTGARMDALDALFISTSAMSTTGLATVDVASSFNLAGELVILLLIQAGGIGYMTFGSFVLLMSHRRLPAWRAGVVQAGFGLPDGLQVAGFVRRVVGFTLLAETLGAALLYLAFRRSGADVVAGAGEWRLAWLALFHSVSAFCTAGFSLFPDGLESFRDDHLVNAVISVLSLTGAMGFILVIDLARRFAGSSRELTLTSRVILRTTVTFLVVGTLVIFLTDEGIESLPAEQRLQVAWFQTMTATTTVGFNTVPISSLALPTVLLMYVMMIVGASPAGTGGGLKSTSISAMFAAVRATLAGRSELTYRGRIIPHHRVLGAFAALGFYVVTLSIGGFVLLLAEERVLDGRAVPRFEDVLFEAASALGTVGLSRGVTGELTEFGKLIVVGLMFIGRLGPLSFGLALFGGGGASGPQGGDGAGEPADLVV